MEPRNAAGDTACLCDEARALLLRSRLIPIKKKDTGVRPVVVGEVLVRLTALCLMRTLRGDALRSIFAPRQLGLGVRNGVESAIHDTQAQINHNPEDVVLTLDIRNGFNSILRSA